MTEVFIHPERKRPKFRPFKAWSHMQKLLADKEDTEQVFHIIEALNGGSLVKNFNQFVESGSGRQLLARKEHIPPILDEHEWLWQLPEGTLGRAYVEFMEREGLTAQGLVDESEKFSSALRDYEDDLEWYGNRLRDTHDLYHVITGYGRDPLGEACLLGFTYSQQPGLGVIFIAYVGAKNIAKDLPMEARVMDCLWEGKRHGREAKRIVEQDVIAMLDQPLEDVRRQLGIAPPHLYQEALRICRAAGVQSSSLLEAA